MNKIALSIGGVPIGTGGVQNIARGAGSLGGNIIGWASALFLFVIILVCLFFMIYGGIRWIMSNGEEKNVEGARNTIVNAAIGLAIAFLAYFFVNIAGAFLHVPLLGK